MIRSLTIKLIMLAGTLAFLVVLNWSGPNRGADTQHLAAQHPLSPIHAVASTSSQKVERRFHNEPSIHAIDVNLSTAQELEALPGIGLILAHRIVEYRMQVGGFQSIEDLDQVKGIGTKKLQALRPLIKVFPKQR
jgi:competence ComEA-like helix-hairpin-helix protein